MKSFEDAWAAGFHQTLRLGHGKNFKKRFVRANELQWRSCRLYSQPSCCQIMIPDKLLTYVPVPVTKQYDLVKWQ